MVHSTLFAKTQPAANELIVYPIPEEIPRNDTFAVKVRNPGGNWNELSCYDVVVDMHDRRSASMAYFDFAGQVNVQVTWNGGEVRSARIRPLSYEIEPLVEGNVLTFSLSEPRNLSIEVNGDIFHNLHLFAGPVERDVPDPDDQAVVFFGPGVHDLEGRLEIRSDSTVYLAGGAVVRGTLYCEGVENVRIRGRGVVYQPQRGVEIRFSNNVEVDGITFINPRYYTIHGGQSRNLVIRNIKSFSSEGWSDGINTMSCSDMLIEGVFMRNSDDCIAIYTHRWDYYGDSRNIEVRDSTLWADVAHPIMMGTHGNTTAPETIENIYFHNIDILNHDEPQIGYQGCIAINASDENLVRNVRFENIRIEDFEQGQLVNIRVTYNRRYASGPGRGIEDILLKDIAYTGENAEISIISGYNNERAVSNVTFENLTINGKLIWDEMHGKPHWFATSDIARFHVGDFVENLTFRIGDEMADYLERTNRD